MSGQGWFGNRAVVTLAVVVLGAALGYSLGVQRGIESVRERRTNLTVDPLMFQILEDAAARARNSGDADTADWLEDAVETNRERVLEWNSEEWHVGTRRPEFRRVNAAGPN